MPIPDSVNLDGLLDYLEKDEQVEVEEVLAFYSVDNEERYLVKWKGWPLSNSTFEPKENVEHLLKEYPNLVDASKIGIKRTEALIKIYKIPVYFKQALEKALIDAESETHKR